MINVHISPEHYTLRFEKYDPELVQFCKNLQQARYNPKGRFWTAVRNVPNAIDLMKAGYCIDTEMMKPKEPGKIIHCGYPWEINAKLYKHQDKWRKWVEGKERCLLAAEMGLGKTLMAMQWLGWLRVEPEHVLIICPISLIQHWQDELKKFMGEDSWAVTGTTKQRLETLRDAGIHICNYEFISKNKEAFNLVKNKECIIIDESHKIKTPKTQRSKAVYELSKQANQILLLTGTPVSQGAQDYYSQIRCINPKLLGSSFTAFKHRYCIEEQIYGAPAGVRRITGYKNLDELVGLLNPYVYSIKKKDCLDLPEKVYTTRYVELTAEQRKIYNEMKYEMMVEMQDGTAIEGRNILTRLIKFSQITQGFLQHGDEVDYFKKNPKLDCLIDILEEVGNEPVVIMCRFLSDIKAVCNMLEEKGISHDKIYGDVRAIERGDIVTRFKYGNFRVLVGQLRVAGVGFNMEHCKKMVFYSNEYSLVDRYQAEDRIHRATSVGESCIYIDIVAQDTIDEHVLRALKMKKDFASQIYSLQKEVMGCI